MTDNRDLDIVIYGATGFTGGLVAEYLQKRASEEGLAWAMAGRNQEKLEQRRSEVGADPSTPIIVADSADADALAALAARTRVVLATAGPFARYGTGLVAACAEHGTDYVDITGEANFVRSMMDAHAATAAANGARIVHCCGVDSMPSDLGVHLLQTELINRTGSPADRIKSRVIDFTGAASGGTIASIMDGVARAQEDPEAAALLRSPFALTPDFAGPEQPDPTTPALDDDLGVWVTNFIMASINTQIVHRTNLLLDHRHSADLRYDEMLVTGPGDNGEQLARDLQATGGIPLDGALPAPGEGPSREQREAGSFHFTFHAPGVEQAPVVGVTGDLDPGYGSTSKMVTEAAITLLRDVPDLAGGSWTPASAMAEPLRDRLTAQGVLGFTVDG
ncbi:MAG: saccharopine dehydrogenase NADP-binding domain-containing protein [Actinomycetota bacterium]